MTFRNKHSIISGFLCAVLLVSGACALGGCTAITEPQGIGNADEDGYMPLTLRATVSDYIAKVAGHSCQGGREDLPLRTGGFFSCHS